MTTPFSGKPPRETVTSLKARIDAIDKEINRVKMDSKNMFWPRNEAGQLLTTSYQYTQEAKAKLDELKKQREIYVQQITDQHSPGAAAASKG